MRLGWENEEETMKRRKNDMKKMNLNYFIIFYIFNQKDGLHEIAQNWY